LGCGDRGLEEVKEHVFFQSVNWDDLLNKRVEPPFKPNKEVECDNTVPFQEDASGIVSPKNKRRKPTANEFKDFDYVSEALLPKPQPSTMIDLSMVVLKAYHLSKLDGKKLYVTWRFQEGTRKYEEDSTAAQCVNGCAEWRDGNKFSVRFLLTKPLIEKEPKIMTVYLRKTVCVGLSTTANTYIACLSNTVLID
jgi:hypothetical protein